VKDKVYNHGTEDELEESIQDVVNNELVCLLNVTRVCQPKEII